MKKIDVFILVLTIVADVAILALFHVWCAGASRTSLLWSGGAFDAYATAYFLGIVACVMASTPAMFIWFEYVISRKK